MTGANENAWDREVDLLVAGAGPGGMTAGLVAALEGLDVLICEKSEQVGGTGATSAGTLWIPGNSQNREAGFADRPEDAARYLDALIGDNGADSRRAVYLEDGPKAIDDLVARSELSFVACGRHPDYRSNLPGAAVEGRAIVSETFDGRKLGADFARVRPPIPEYLLFGGMMVGKVDLARMLGRYRSVGNFAHTVGLVLRYFVDRLRFPAGHPADDGKRAGRPALLQPPAERRSGRVRRGARRDRRGGRPRRRRRSGDRERAEIRVRARRGVVLATGGMAHNEAFREAFMPRAVPKYSLAVEENTGDGLAAGERFGGQDREQGRGRSVDPGFAQPAQGRRHRALSAHPARPRQAGPDRGERGRPALRQRGGVLSRLRRRHVPGA